MEFIEAPYFSRKVGNYLSDDEYAALQWSLAFRPNSGPVIPGSGGLRKLRWGIKGQGKRSGIRIIYYWKKSDHEIWLLAIYAKNEITDLSHEVLRRLKKEIGS